MSALARVLPLLLPLPVFAGFSELTQELPLSYGQSSAVVVFATADGTSVTKAKPLCDCTKVRLEGNRLVAQVDTSTFDASVEKQIVATTSDGRRSTLTMRFEVPQAVLLSSPGLVWERGSAPAPQEFRIRIPKGSPVRALRSADLSGSDFDYSTKTVTPGREYVVTVVPKSTANKCLNRLVIRMDSSNPAPQFAQRILYIRVR